MILIGITGLKSSGKSVVADTLVEQFNFQRIPFAGSLKDMIAVMLRHRGCAEQYIYDVLWGDKKETPIAALNGRTARHAMQTLGTEWGRDLIHPGIWTSVWMDRAQAAERVVVDDMRFQNEVELVENLGGLALRVERPSIVPSDPHVSETNILTLPVHRVLYNTGTIDELKIVAREMARRYVKEQTHG